VVFAAGVLGTVDLMLKLKDTTLPLISHCVGKEVFTNNESLIGVISFDKLTDFSEGVAIGSILQTDANSHVEPVRYSRSSGFWRLLMAPLTQGPTFRKRLVMMASELFHHPLQHLRVFFMPNIASHTTILLFMQHLPGALSLKRGLTGIQTVADPTQQPSTVIPQAGDLARRFASIVNGKPMVVITESLFGNPTTAHLLGGAVMGNDPSEGVIDTHNRVFGYRNMYVCDGSMISANPGVNPSLTILAMAERAMDQIS
jgi:cholesterol oxidase